MRKVIQNGTVITMDKNRKQYEKVDIVIDDDTITSIVKHYKGEYDLLIDAKDKVVLPGLINGHTHLGMSYFRATNDVLTLQDWLMNMIWPVEAKMSDEDTYYGTLLSLLEMIKTGTTCSNDMYLNCSGSLKALKEAKVRCLFTRCLIDNDNFGDSRIDEFLKLYEENQNDPLIRFSVAVHGLYTCGVPYLEKCSDLAYQLQLPLHIHYCENKKEIQDIYELHHMSPLEVLKKANVFKNHLIMAHATFIDDESLEYFRDKDVHFVHNPISNLNLGCGISNITKYRKYVNICLGTDGQGSGNNLNMLYHMSFVDLLQQGYLEDSTVFSSYEVLKMATIRGAKALGMDDIIGSIEVGKKADIILLDLEDSLTQPSPNLISNVVHNGFNHVSMTMINGEVLYKDGEFLLKLDEKKIIKKVNQLLNRLNK